MADPFIGQIMQVGFNFAPRGWAACTGQIIAINQNAALFSLIGTTFGGNGQTTFQLPNFQSRVAIGIGTGTGLSPYIWGQVGGQEQVVLSVSNMPAHSHAATVTPPTATLQASTGIAAATSTQIPAAGSTLCNANDPLGGGTPQIYAPTGAGGTPVNLGGLTVAGGSVTNASTGNNAPTPTLPPYLAVQTNIALAGIFPSRN
jgi:microcystin-dependent protein